MSNDGYFLSRPSVLLLLSSKHHSLSHFQLLFTHVGEGVDLLDELSIDFPVKTLYLPQLPDRVGQEKIQCIFCERDFVGPFTVCWIHLLRTTGDPTTNPRLNNKQEILLNNT